MKDFEKYIAELPPNHVEALSKICADFFRMHQTNRKEFGGAWQDSYRHEYQMFYRIARKFVVNFDLDFELPEEIYGNNRIHGFFVEFDIWVSSWLAEQFFDQKYAPTSDSILLDQTKSKEIQAKTNELRDIVSNADYLNEKHRTVLLKRLEKFQAELHKSISNFDVFLAGWGDINDMVEETGNKSKPIVDRFREILIALKPERNLAISSEEKPKQITDQTDEEKAEAK